VRARWREGRRGGRRLCQTQRSYLEAIPSRARLTPGPSQPRGFAMGVRGDFLATSGESGVATDTDVDACQLGYTTMHNSAMASASSREPLALINGKRFHSVAVPAYAAEWLASRSQLDISVPRPTGRNGRADLILVLPERSLEIDEHGVLDQFNSTGVIAVEAKSTDWDIQTERAVRRNVRRHALQLWAYMDHLFKEFDSCALTYLGACMLYRAAPRDEAVKAMVEEALLDPFGIHTCWYKEASALDFMEASQRHTHRQRERVRAVLDLRGAAREIASQVELAPSLRRSELRAALVGTDDEGMSSTSASVLRLKARSANEAYGLESLIAEISLAECEFGICEGCPVRAPPSGASGARLGAPLTDASSKSKLIACDHSLSHRSLALDLFRRESMRYACHCACLRNLVTFKSLIRCSLASGENGGPPWHRREALLTQLKEAGYYGSDAHVIEYLRVNGIAAPSQYVVDA
jgi:hypothetical protein